MTQPPRGRSDFYQVLVFLVVIAIVLVGLVVGGSGSSSRVTPTSAATTEATSIVTAEATAAATAVSTAEATTAATAEATSVATVEATLEATSTVAATAALTAEATTEATIEPTLEVTSEATLELTAESAAPSVRFVAPHDGTNVTATFTVVMAADGLTVEPAGDIHDNAGHFHILIDTPFIPAGEVIPKDETHLHFGQGQTTTELTLTPGKHVLRLQFANGAHIALEGDQYRAEITVNVVAGS